MNTQRQFSPDQEIYSVDESFLSLAGFGKKDLSRYGQDIKATILQWTGMPVCVGIGATKTLPSWQIIVPRNGRTMRGYVT